MKTMNISPLSLVLLLTFMSQQKVHTAESGRGDDQRGIYPSLDSAETAYRSTGPVPIPRPTAHATPSFPPSYYTDDRRGSEGRTPPSGYFSDPGISSPHAQFPPSPGYYAYPPYHPAYPYPSCPPHAGPQWAQPAPAGHAVSLPSAEPSKGHRRQRSNTFNIGDLSLGTDTDDTDGVKEIPVPRQLQDSVGIFTTERDLLVAAAQNFLRKAREEGKATIEGFNTINAGDASPGDRRRDSTFGKLAKGLRSADKNAERELTHRCKDLERKKGPYQERFLCLAAQCTVMKDALERATEKLTSSLPE